MELKLNSHKVVLLAYLTFILTVYYASAQETIAINSLSQNQVYQFDSALNTGESTLKIVFTNNMLEIDERKNTFLCFLVSQEETNIKDGQIIFNLDGFWNMDTDNCYLQNTQTINVELNLGINKVFITPLFLDEFKIVSPSRQFSIETSAKQCDQLCNGGNCGSTNAYKFLCKSCPKNKSGNRCQLSVNELQGKQYINTHQKLIPIFLNIVRLSNVIETQSLKQMRQA